MRIETYSKAYFGDVARLIKEFHEEAVAEYDGEFNAEAVTETISTGEPANCFLLILDGVCQGLLYGTRFRSTVNGKPIFQEIMWYVSKDYRIYGVKLLKEVEKHLQSEGVSIMIMAVLQNSKTEKLERFYERIGYKPMETHFVKELNGLG